VVAVSDQRENIRDEYSELQGKTPLKRYQPKGYVKGVHDALRVENDDGGHRNDERGAVALDAAVFFTASNMGAPFATDIGDAGDWWEPAYDAACKALETQIVDGLLSGRGVSDD